MYQHQAWKNHHSEPHIVPKFVGFTIVPKAQNVDVEYYLPCSQCSWTHLKIIKESSIISLTNFSYEMVGLQQCPILFQHSWKAHSSEYPAILCITANLICMGLSDQVVSDLLKATWLILWMRRDLKLDLVHLRQHLIIHFTHVKAKLMRKCCFQVPRRNRPICPHNVVCKEENSRGFLL